MDQLLQLLDIKFVLLCRVCGKKVMDPDKKKGETYLKGKCPSCGEESKENKKSKKERKRERQAAKLAAQNAGHRAKY